MEREKRRKQKKNKMLNPLVFALESETSTSNDLQYIAVSGTLERCQFNSVREANTDRVQRPMTWPLPSEGGKKSLEKDLANQVTQLQVHLNLEALKVVGYALGPPKVLQSEATKRTSWQ